MLDFAAHTLLKLHRDKHLWLRADSLHILVIYIVRAVAQGEEARKDL